MTALPTLRTITHRITGTAHGPITRLISPQLEVGEWLKPFIFLDFFDAEIQPGFGFGMHPHSGIATLTWQPGTDVQYEDTTGQKGLLKAGGLEWMNAGGGAWHQGFLMGSGRATGFQLWVAMPPGVEDGPSVGQYVPPHEVGVLPIAGGAVRVLLGAVAGPQGLVRSPINSHQDMHYGVLTLQAGARWRYEPPAQHDVAWAFVFAGTGSVQGQATHKELLVLSESGALEFSAAQGPVQVLWGTARRHAHDLVLGSSSVHTSAASLQQGQARIRALGAELRQAGRLG